MSVLQSTVEEWAARVRPHLHQAAEAIIAAGRELVAAKAALPHGEFLRMVDTLDLSPRTAQRFMAIASHPVLADATHGSHLPTSWRTLAELARVSEDVLADAIEAGDVHPAMTRADAEHLLSNRHNTAAPADDAVRRFLYDFYSTIESLCITVTDTGMEFPDDLPFEDWVKVGNMLRLLAGSGTA